MVATIFVERMGALNIPGCANALFKFDKPSWNTKSPLLANVRPGCRLTLVLPRALMFSGLWTAQDRTERSTASTAGRVPDRRHWPRLSLTSSSAVLRSRGTAFVKCAPQVRGGLMGNSATVDAGQEQHLQALEYANRVRLARAQMKRKIADGGAVGSGRCPRTSPWQATQHVDKRPADEPEALGTDPLQTVARVTGRAGEQAGRNAHRAPARGAGRDVGRKNAPQEPTSIAHAHRCASPLSAA